MTISSQPVVSRPVALLFAMMTAFGSFDLMASSIGENRPPAVPLIAHDPYFSLWQMADTLTERDAQHWTNVEMPIRCMVRIDGKAYRLMGAMPGSIPAAEQVARSVLPTTTRYTFVQDGVQIQLSFTSPLLMDDIELLSRPVTILEWTFQSLTDPDREVELYLDVAGAFAADRKNQMLEWEREEQGDMSLLRIGTVEQNVLGTVGDDVRIDWGYFYLATERSAFPNTYMGSNQVVTPAWLRGEWAEDEERATGSHMRARAVLATSSAPMRVGLAPETIRAYVAYDDLYSVELFQERLRPWWNRDEIGIRKVITDTMTDAGSILERCARFDAELLAECEEVGGPGYAYICSLAYRQAIAAHKVVAGPEGEMLCFSKENFSNGSMGTVDVFYPAAPLFLRYNPELMKAQMTPIFDYARMPRWPWPYAPHDIGKYPLGNGQTYGGGEQSEDRQMPVEECGNMILLAAAISTVDGNANYASEHWDMLTQWADYLRDHGFDPANQLSTDDFSGHLASNANLSVKAILAIRGYAEMCAMRGEKTRAEEYRAVAAQFVEQWLEAADDGEHYRLAFDQPGTWSMKYNLVWDKVLGYSLFPDKVFEREWAKYIEASNDYGLPLDSREHYTKLDWILWVAAIAEGETYDALVDPVVAFLNESPHRVPMSDWYWTGTGEVVGFQARSVVGGVFMRALHHHLNR